MSHSDARQELDARADVGFEDPGPIDIGSGPSDLGPRDVESLDAVETGDTGDAGVGDGASAFDSGLGSDAGALECSEVRARCVGAGREYATIQAAADDASPGDTVLVLGGRYAGFQVSTSGTESEPIVFRAESSVVIDRPAGTGDGIRLQNVSHVHLEGFEIESPPERCVSARGATPDDPMRGLLIRRVRCSNAGVEGFYLSEVADSLVELNEISGSGSGGSTRSHGIYLANAGSDGTTIRQNSISNAGPAESNGIHVNGDLSVGGDGIVSGLVVDGNIIHHNAQNGLNFDGVQDSVVINNILYENGRNGLRGYAIDGAEGPASLRVINNTFSTGSSGGWALKLTEDLGGHIVFNNILLSGNSSTGAICVESSDRLESASNAGTGRFSADDESSVIDPSEWADLGLDTDWIEASAGSLFAGASDFHLKSGAPTIDEGVATFAGFDAPSSDFEGSPRPNGAAFDRGADER